MKSTDTKELWILIGAMIACALLILAWIAAMVAVVALVVKYIIGL